MGSSFRYLFEMPLAMMLDLLVRPDMTPRGGRDDDARFPGMIERQALGAVLIEPDLVG